MDVRLHLTTGITVASASVLTCGLVSGPPGINTPTPEIGALRLATFAWPPTAALEEVLKGDVVVNAVDIASTAMTNRLRLVPTQGPSSSQTEANRASAQPEVDAAIGSGEVTNVELAATTTNFWSLLTDSLLLVANVLPQPLLGVFFFAVVIPIFIVLLPFAAVLDPLGSAASPATDIGPTTLGRQTIDARPPASTGFQPSDTNQTRPDQERGDSRQTAPDKERGNNRQTASTNKQAIETNEATPGARRGGTSQPTLDEERGSNHQPTTSTERPDKRQTTPNKREVDANEATTATQRGGGHPTDRTTKRADNSRDDGSTGENATGN